MLLLPNVTPLTAGSVSAPVTAMSTSPPCSRAENPPNATSMVARSSGFASSRLANRCERRSAAPDRVTPTWASPARPKSSTTASGPVRSTSRVVIAVLLRSSCCPELYPAARPLAWVDTAELAGQRDRTGRDRGPRFGAARHRQPRVTADQVGEARCGPGESHQPRASGVGADELCDGQPGPVGHLGKVRAVVDDIDHHVDAAGGSSQG